MSTHTQFRAVCPECFNEQAIKVNERMVDHGYTIPHEWHQRNGSCGGVGAVHFGTVDGRKHTEGYAKRMNEYITGQRIMLADAPKLTTIRGRNSDRSTFVNGRMVSPPDVDLTAADGRWFDQAKRNHIARLENNIRNAVDFVKFLKGKLAEWKEQTPRSVEVETGPTLHAVLRNFRSGQLFKGKAQCSSSGFSRRFLQTTNDDSRVTCSRCLKTLAQQTAVRSVPAKD